jgi:hypothetical protein
MRRVASGEIDILREPGFWATVLLAVTPILIVTGVILLVQ